MLPRFVRDPRRGGRPGAGCGWFAPLEGGEFGPGWVRRKVRLAGGLIKVV